MISLEILDRTLFEYIRRGAVEQGVLPDWRTFTVGTIQERQAAYEAAKAAIRNNGTEVLEIYGVGSAKARGAKAISIITIDRKNMVNGSIGGAGDLYEEDGGGFIKRAVPDSTCNVNYEVRIVCNTTKAERQAATVIAKKLGRRRGLKCLNLSSGNFDGEYIIIESQGAVPLSGDDFIEWVYSFQVVDVWIDEATLVSTSIVPLTTINIKTYVADRLQTFEEGQQLPPQIIT